MTDPDGFRESEGDLPFLPQQDGYDGIRRFFDDLYASAGLPPAPPYRVVCCVCGGTGRITTAWPGLTGTSNTPCLACDGSGSVGMVRERRGTR